MVCIVLLINQRWWSYHFSQTNLSQPKPNQTRSDRSIFSPYALTLQYISTFSFNYSFYFNFEFILEISSHSIVIFLVLFDWQWWIWTFVKWMCVCNASPKLNCNILYGPATRRRGCKWYIFEIALESAINVGWCRQWKNYANLFDPNKQWAILCLYYSIAIVFKIIILLLHIFFHFKS